MDRRAFLAKAAGAGVVVVGGDLIAGVGSAFAAKPPATRGYGIGDPAADFKGFDQYMEQRKLSDNRGSWVLIDLCPKWCVPCNASARFQFNFTQYIRNQGIPFHMQPVVVETDTEGTPSVRSTAEDWAHRYELEREALLHCDGDPNSPLRQLADMYAAANNVTDPGRYPTYVLVDPKGVIRDYIRGADLNAVQASLANKTGKTLNGEWNNEAGLIPYQVLPDPAVGSASFKLWNGTPVSLSGASHLENQYCVFDNSSNIVSIDLWPKLGDPVTLVSGNPVRDHAKLIDLHSPITMSFGATITPDPSSYRTLVLDQQPPIFIEYAPGFYSVSDHGGEFKGEAGPGIPVRGTDGSIQVQFTPSDFFADPGNMWGPDDDARASNQTSFTYSIVPGPAPYGAALLLTDTVNADPTLSNKTQKTVADLVKDGLAKLGNRDYRGSAQKFEKAQNTLTAASAPDAANSAEEIKNSVAWLGTHYS